MDGLTILPRDSALHVGVPSTEKLERMDFHTITLAMPACRAAQGNRLPKFHISIPVSSWLVLRSSPCSLHIYDHSFRTPFRPGRLFCQFLYPHLSRAIIHIAFGDPNEQAATYHRFECESMFPQRA